MRSLTRYLLRGTFATLILQFNVVTFAQNSTALQHKPAPNQAADLNNELAKMNKRYKLEAKQRREIKLILESEAEDFQNIATDSSLSQDQRGEKDREVHRVCNREIDAVLHDRQRALFDQDQGYTTAAQQNAP
jgi:hypothetical protein